MALAVKHEPGTPARALGKMKIVGEPENGLLIDKLVVLDAAPNHARHGWSVTGGGIAQGVHIGKVDPSIFVVAWIQCDVVHS